MLTWLISDHHGSTSVTADAGGNLLSSLRYTTFGEVRAASGTTSTDYRYTGQRCEAEIGLYYYVARFYDPALGRFISADSIVPGAGNPIARDRYAYTNNDPINNVDPTGHWVETALDIAFITYDVYDIKTNGLNWISGLSLVADVVGAILPVVTGGGLAVRALIHAVEISKAAKVVDNVIDTAEIINNSDDVVDSGEMIYLSMTTADDGLPRLGESDRELGARVPQDIVPKDGNVLPGAGGMSVSLNGPYNLPEHRRPSDFGGTGKAPVLRINTNDLGPDLTYRPDPARPQNHGFIEPAYRMHYTQYQQALDGTRSKWTVISR